MKIVSPIPMLRMFIHFNGIPSTDELYELSLSKTHKLIGSPEERTLSDVRMQLLGRAKDGMLFMTNRDFRYSENHRDTYTLLKSIQSSGTKVFLVPNSSYIRAILGQSPRSEKDYTYFDLKEVICKAKQEIDKKGKITSKWLNGVKTERTQGLKVWMVKLALKILGKEEPRGKKKKSPVVKAKPNQEKGITSSVDNDAEGYVEFKIKGYDDVIEKVEIEVDKVMKALEPLVGELCKSLELSILGRMEIK